MTNFNEITLDAEKATVIKFKEYGLGIPMGAYNKGIRLDDEDSAKWADLTDDSKWSLQTIKNKMIELASKINSTCNDELLGDLTVAFSKRDNKNKLVKVTFMEMYTFLRAAYRDRKESAEYRTKAAEVKRLNDFIEANKSTEDRLKEATEKLAKLKAEGISLDETEA